MKDIDLYCMCLNEHHIGNIKKLGYIPVGLGSNDFSKDWIRDNTGKNMLANDEISLEKGNQMVSNINSENQILNLLA